MKIKASSDTAFERLIARFVGFYADNLFNAHWGEQVKLGRDNTLEVAMVSQGLDRAQLDALWRPFGVGVMASPQDFSLMWPLSTWAVPAQTFWDVENNPSMIHDTRAGSPKHHSWWRGDQDQVGGFVHGYESLWLPASLLEQNQQPRLVKALFAATRFKQLSLHMNKGLAGATPEARAAALQTATNPAVVDAFTLAIIADGEGPAYPGLSRPPTDLKVAHADARAIDLAIAELRKIAPDAGSYLSESNYFNPSWQRAYWGSNYERLHGIKKKYDPEGLFFVHHGVGSEEWSADGFTRV
jgi:FAD/FMN-containing dehydrogenase